MKIQSRKWKSFWMAHLGLSLALLLLVVPLPSSEGGVVSISKSTSKVIQRRETNPPFQFTSYSDETTEESPTTLNSLRPLKDSTEDEFTTGPSAVSTLNNETTGPSEESSSQYYSSGSDERDVLGNTSPTSPYDDQSSVSSSTNKNGEDSQEKEVLAGEGSGERGTTYTSLLTPLPQTTASTGKSFSEILLGNVSSTAVPVALSKSNRVGNRGLEIDRNRQNANSVVLVDPSSGGLVSVTDGRGGGESDTSSSSSANNDSLLRTVRPTSSVIFNNPSTYSRIVKRKKITSINGRNLTRPVIISDSSDGTTFSPVAFSSAEATTTDAYDVPTTYRSSVSPASLKHNGSRAIAGFSAKGPSKIVTKTRPKPIIIRDHDAYLKNLTTDASSGTEESITFPVTTVQITLDEESVQPPTDQPSTVYQNVLPTPPHKVRKVKVPIRRQPGQISSTYATTSESPSSSASSSPSTEEETSSTSNPIALSTHGSETNQTLMADAAHERPDYDMVGIRPSPAIRHDDDSPPRRRTESKPKITSKRIFKEEFGITRDSYGTDADEDEEYNRSHGGPEEDPMEVDATTEHYYHSVEPPMSQFSIESSINSGHPHEMRNAQENFMENAGTPKYRDYFSDVFGNPPTGGSGSDSSPAPHDNHNHLYRENNNNNSGGGGGNSEDPSSAVTVTVTKTVVHDSPPTASPTVSFNRTLIINDQADNVREQSVIPLVDFNVGGITATPALPQRTSSTGDSSSSKFLSNQEDHSTLKSVNQESLPVTTNSVDDSYTNGMRNNSSTSDNIASGQPSDNHHGQSNDSLYENAGDRINGDLGGVNPTTVSSKDVTGVYFTKVERPNYTSSSYEFTTSKHVIYSYGDGHHDHLDNGGHHNDHHNEEDHDLGSGSGDSHHPEDDHPDNIEYLPKGQEIHPTTSIRPFWDATEGTVAVNSSGSQTTPVVLIDQQREYSTAVIDKELMPPANATANDRIVIPSGKNSTRNGGDLEEPEVQATEQNFTTPLIDTEDEEDQGSKIKAAVSDSPKKSTTTASTVSSTGSTKKTTTTTVNGGETIRTATKSTSGISHKKPKFPAMYQVPFLVKMELEIPRFTFCTNLAKFKRMIVTVYEEQRPGVDESQIIIYTEPNCTSATSDLLTDFLNSTSSSDPQSQGLVGTTSKSFDGKATTPKPSSVERPTKGPGGVKNETGSSPTQSESSEVNEQPGKSVNNTKSGGQRRRRRRAEKQLEVGGESLILDRKNGLGRDQDVGDIPEKNNSSVKPEAPVAVYFFMNDKNGNYDQELTMAFIQFWNETTKSNQSGGALEGIFYQKIKNVGMFSSSQLVAPEDPETNENSGIIAAIAIASIAATCLFLIGVLLLVLRHRQAQTKFAKRCTPVTLDDYSLDNISFSNSFRRKQRLRGSKRSYTNAAFDDQNAPSRTVNSSTLHAALTDVSGLESEFKKIPNVNPTLDDIPQGAEKKNRYANVIPMPDTRVLMTFQEEQPNSDYINANYVRGPNGDAKRYIITQGPLDDTAVDFWRMVWEQQVRVIFMITDFAEAGVPKCADYYPRSETIDCSQLHGDYQVTLEKRDVTENCITSYLVIKDMERNLRRDVIHLWYHSWPDKGVPPTGKPTADFLLKSRKFTKEPTPVLVHCSNGTGRSGTIVACDIAMKELETNQKVDIPRIVLKIRQDRAGSVQTREQYTHIYEVLHYYSNRIAPVQMESIP